MVYVPAGVELVLDTEGSNYDTVLAVYRNPRAAAVDCDDDGGPGATSFLRVPASRTGQLYYIQLGGYKGAQGHFVLHYNMSR